MPKISNVMAGLAPLSLHPKDHVSIYVLDCSLVRSLNDAPADALQLKLGVDKALESWRVRQQNRKEPSCQQAIHLWDALTYIASELYKLPGRRVILAVSQGDDEGSGRTWNEVRAYMQATGVAVVGMTHIYTAKEVGHAVFLRWSSEDPFHLVCELSGGVVLLTHGSELEETMKRFITILRERYIVEFPRPANATSGAHSMEVAIGASNDYIRSAGISVPIPDAAVLADPTTVPSDPARAPEMGTRHPMEKPQ
jgi:hypothetical protein